MVIQGCAYSTQTAFLILDYIKPLQLVCNIRLSSSWVNATPHKDLIISSNVTRNTITVFHSFLTKEELKNASW